MLFFLQQGLGETLQQNPLLALATLFGAGVLTMLKQWLQDLLPQLLGMNLNPLLPEGAEAASFEQRNGYIVFRFR